MTTETPPTTSAPTVWSTSIKNPEALKGRPTPWTLNTPTLLSAHTTRNSPIIRTRFPPEPNGYLHIGHAKSMNMNFRLAFEKLGVDEAHRRTVFRYDDTNPAAESVEYIDSIRRDMEWLGWTPERTTYSSENFQTLYDLAETMIEKGLAYVCDMTKDEVEKQRQLALERVNARNLGKDPDVLAPIPSPDVLPGRNRDTSVSRNLAMFRNMRLGLYDEGTHTLRLKMDFESANPNMYDLVAYRIKYVAHPHAGKGWCIYPSYDFTHGICDSLEDVDYSICTLEFETRREPYYWILHQLDMYRPNVYEMSRLNLAYTVMSKRMLRTLVEREIVRGWTDPRMPTIGGLRRRGYTAEIINTFCNDIGATKASNTIEMDKLHQTARLSLSGTARRAMAALDPIKITITNFQEESTKADGQKGMTFEVPNSPTDPTLGSHTVEMTDVIYIDSSDFRSKDEKSYYGLAPNKAVGLKYHGGNLICDGVLKSDKDGKTLELNCRLDTSEDRPKPKSYLTWVPKSGIKCEVRVYNNLFNIPEPTERYIEELNVEKSEIIYREAIIDPSVKGFVDVKHVDKWRSNPALQFERIGYFVVDEDTTYDSTKTDGGAGKLVFNRTVSLKEEVFKKQITKEEADKIEQRKAKVKADAEAKEIRMKIAVEDLFKKAPEYEGLYGKFNDEGIPTHLKDGSEMTKSAMKKLGKERSKHIKALASYNKNKK